MAETLKLGNGEWATKENSLLSYNDENGNYKPLPFDFTRASSATVVNKAGLIETVQSGIPRIDFLGNTNGALLLEPQRTNLNTYSDPTDAQKGSTSYAAVTYQDNFNWGLGNVINNAIVFGDNSTTRYAYYNNAVSSGTEYTLSAFIKMDDNSVPIPATDFLIVLAGSSIASGYSVKDYGNNIYRVYVSGNAGGSNTANGILKVASNSSKGFKISAFQLEQGSYPTSYIPTQGSTVTRVAETCNGAGNDQVFNDSEGVLYVETSLLNESINDSRISISDGLSVENRITLRYFDNNDLGVQIGFTGGFNETVSLSAGNNKVAVVYNSTNASIFVNGVKLATNTMPSLSGLSQLQFARFSNSSLPFYGKTKDVKVFNTALTDAELQALTTI